MSNNTPSSAFKEGEKKELWRVLVVSKYLWGNSTGFGNNPIFNYAVKNETIAHTNLQRNYFKRIV